MKIIERNGPQLTGLLTRSDPWAGGDCGRETGSIFSQDWDKKPNCRQSNTTYRITCQLCLKEGIKAVYIGETSRSMYKRMREHKEDAVTDLEGSHIATYLRLTHPQAGLAFGESRDG